jgi:hypothetical protein
VAGCAPGSSRQALDEGTDPRLTLSTYYEEGRLAFLAVDTRAASLVRKGDIFPLAVIYVNKSERSLRLGSESFTLRDSDGNVYPLIPYETFRAEYRQRVGADLRLSEPFYEATNIHLGIDGTSVSPYRAIAIPLYGVGTPRSNRFELGVKSYARGFLYFPVPEGGLEDQVLELNVRSPDLADDVFVKFRVR